MAEWRECVFAGASLGYRQRFCDRVLDLTGGAVMVGQETCAACPVPALVEAVRAVATLDEPDFPVGYDWMFELVHAAFAAIEEVKRG